MEELILMLRYFINDVESTTYSDSRLTKAILIGARYVNPLFNNMYTISVASSAISPDPVSNQAFMNLVTLKTACLIGVGEAKISAGQGIAIKDGSSSLDLKGMSISKSDMMKSYCEMFEDAKRDFLSGGDGADGPPGAAVLGPINIYNQQMRARYGERGL